MHSNIVLPAKRSSMVLSHQNSEVVSNGKSKLLDAILEHADALEKEDSVLPPVSSPDGLDISNRAAEKDYGSTDNHSECSQYTQSRNPDKRRSQKAEGSKVSRGPRTEPKSSCRPRKVPSCGDVEPGQDPEDELADCFVDESCLNIDQRLVQKILS
jgi:hypothetical protein